MMFSRDRGNFTGCRWTIPSFSGDQVRHDALKRAPFLKCDTALIPLPLIPSDSTELVAGRQGRGDLIFSDPQFFPHSTF